MGPDGTNDHKFLTFREKKKQYQSTYDLFKPIKSPCFNLETYKAPISTSIKERIKLNKHLTISQRTGRLIGVNTSSKPKDTLYSSGINHF